MDGTPLPETLDVAIVRRFKCVECGKLGRRRATCECGNSYFDDIRILKFGVKK